MALQSTPYKADISLTDLDRGGYETLRLTVARHPSETEEPLAGRLLGDVPWFGTADRRRGWAWSGWGTPAAGPGERQGGGRLCVYTVGTREQERAGGQADKEERRGTHRAKSEHEPKGRGGVGWVWGGRG